MRIHPGAGIQPPIDSERGTDRQHLSLQYELTRHAVIRKPSSACRETTRSFNASGDESAGSEGGISTIPSC